MTEPRVLSAQQAVLSALLVLGLSALCGLISNALSPRSLALFEPMPRVAPGDVDLLTASALLEHNEAVFLDARSPGRFSGSHVPGAHQLSSRNFSQRYSELAPSLKGKKLVVYCSGKRCPKADRLRRLLESSGHEEVLVLREGIRAWRKAGLPLEKSP